jgi:type IV secretory pathway TraG/TraD family ATPase VirD4
VNLSKGRIGEDNANMIGSLLVTKFQIDAMSRADVPFHQRRDFYLYIDEFQNFVTDSFKSILSEARKYKLSLIIANQYIAQILPDVIDAIFGNVGTTIAFTVGKDDADLLSGQFK